MIIRGCGVWKTTTFNPKTFPLFLRVREREKGRERHLVPHTQAHSLTDTHTHGQTLEKRDKAAEDKTVGGIFSRVWNIGLAEPGKTTVKHNNKRNTTVKR